MMCARCAEGGGAKALPPFLLQVARRQCGACFDAVSRRPTGREAALGEHAQTATAEKHAPHWRERI